MAGSGAAGFFLTLILLGLLALVGWVVYLRVKLGKTPTLSQVFSTSTLSSSSSSSTSSSSASATTSSSSSVPQAAPSGSASIPSTSQPIASGDWVAFLSKGTPANVIGAAGDIYYVGQVCNVTGNDVEVKWEAIYPLGTTLTDITSGAKSTPFCTKAGNASYNHTYYGTCGSKPTTCGPNLKNIFVDTSTELTILSGPPKCS